MADLFLTIQLNRAVWISLLDEKKIHEGIEEFEKYVNLLKESATTKIVTNKIAKELKNVYKLLVEKLSDIAEEYIKNKDYTNAIICYKKIFDYDPENIKNIEKYIKLLEQLEQYDIELELGKYLITIDNSANHYKLLSEIYGKNKIYNEALRNYLIYLRKNNTKKISAEQYNVIGCYYFNYFNNQAENRERKYIIKSLKYFLKAVKLEKKNKVYLKNTISAANKAKKKTIEKKYWKPFLELGYANAEDELSYSALCMITGDFEGWGKYYNSRFKIKNPAFYPKTDKPEWNGLDDIGDKTLLVHYEQGFGDSILIFAYLEQLTKVAKHVIFVVQDVLYDLFKRNTDKIEIIPKSNADLTKLEFDYFIPAMSVISVLNLTKENISVGAGYLKPNLEKVEYYKRKFFKSNKLKIGLSFSSKGNKSRDIPIEALLQLDNMENVDLYCFSKDVDYKDMEKFKNHKLINIVKYCDTFDDTAAAITNTDIVLSSDNCILNLAGATGKKTIGIFNYYYEFRWYDLTGEDCGYYTCVKPIVNNEYDNWDLSMKKAIAYIEKYRNEKRER